VRSGRTPGHTGRWLTCNVVFPQLFWFKKVRTSIPMMFVIAIFVNVGMWFERCHRGDLAYRGFPPSSWGHYMPSIYDVGIFVGSLGLFFTLILLFVRVLPVISLAEIKAVIPGAQPERHRPH